MQIASSITNANLWTYFIKQKLQPQFEITIQKFTMEQAKRHLKWNTVTIKNISVMKNIKKTQNCLMSIRDLRSLILALKFNFAFWKNAHLPQEKELPHYVYTNFFFIIEYKGDNFLIQRSEPVSEYRHKNKLKLINQQTWYVWNTEISLNFLLGKSSIGGQSLQIFIQISHESAETVRLRKIFSPGR